MNEPVNISNSLDADNEFVMRYWQAVLPLLLQVNMKYLSPLIVAYDDQLKQKNDVILQYEVSISIL